LAHAVHRKETQTEPLGLTAKICYKDHWWKICAELNVIAMLPVLQGGYIKYGFLQCERGSRARNCHYRIKKFPLG
jgi:hypothetical protein